MKSPNCYSALKSEVTVDLFHVKPHCLFIHLWLINVVSEITERGRFVFNTHFSSLIAIRAKKVWLSVAVQRVSQQCVPQWGVGVWSCRLMDYTDICFIHSSTTLLQQPHCAPQKCSSSHREARPPINKMVTMQNPDKIWMLFILWKWQMGGEWGGGFTIARGWCQEGFQSEQQKRS